MITEWAASVERSGAGGGHNNGFYSITFQVWRPNSPSPVVDGCYNMTGSNYFPDIVLDSDRAVRETPLASKRIHVQPGDVVGFYLTAIENDNNGIPFDDDYTDESVWYATGNIISTGNPTCQFPVGNGRTLSVFTNLAPRITAAVCELSDNNSSDRLNCYNIIINRSKKLVFVNTNLYSQPPPYLYPCVSNVIWPLINS